MARPNKRNGIVLEQTFDKLGRCSDANYHTCDYSNSCYRGNHKQCKGLNRTKTRCTCPKCNHPEPESKE
ncbi:MAG: hypothetical protein K5790_10245 [Nitrosopumilus sp.]|uniref:hypothetical protein n=1 Tax=Nitrosopumilus sp. TaxID=2024843 RepID=UPI00247C54C7|nr:hypothetical protein [Nitrosopumilus sp.]MCV0393649.1 hypothetical protein [Nitrosopumilus sp.]